MSNGIFDEKTVQAYTLTLDNAGGTSWTQLAFSGVPTTFRMDYLWATTDSLVDLVVWVGTCNILEAVSNSVPIGAVTVPAGSGNGSLPMVDVLALLFGTQGLGFCIPSDRQVTVRVGTALASGKFLYLLSQGGDL